MIRRFFVLVFSLLNFYLKRLDNLVFTFFYFVYIGIDKFNWFEVILIVLDSFLNFTGDKNRYNLLKRLFCLLIKIAPIEIYSRMLCSTINS